MDLLMFQETVVYVEDNYIAISPLCNFFGITYKGQIEKIKTDNILQSEWKKTSNEKVFGDKRGRVSLTKRGFLRWVQLLNPAYVKEDLREKLSQYQAMIFDWMFGTVENRDNAAIAHKRLKKLKSLYAKIGVEIQRCEKQVRTYIDGHLGQQGQLDFKTS